MKFTNELKLPQPLVDAVTNDPYHAGACEFSVTGLLNAPRRRVLLKKHDHEIEEDIADRLWALFGQVGHGILERAAIDDGTRVIEKRFFADIAGVKISGQLDLLEFSARNLDKKLKFLEKGILADYKIMSVWEIVYGMREEKIAQQNMLAWLCQNNGLKVDKLQIVSLLRDWSKTKAKQGGDYPSRNIVVTSLPYWSKEKTEQYIKERIRLHKEAEEILPLCSEDDRWHKDNKYAVMKEGRKSAMKVCASLQNAQDHMVWKISDDAKLVGKLSIVERLGEDIRCEHYCAAAPFCYQFQETLKEKSE